MRDRSPLPSALTLLLLLAPGVRADDGPHLLVPPHPDSARADVPPAPLIVPGRPVPPDSSFKTREQLAREQYALGLALERSGAYAAAITAFRNATRFDRTLRGPNAHVGALFARVAEWDEASIAYAAEVALAPNDHESARELGMALANLGDSSRAVTQLQMLARRRPRDPAVWQSLGFAYGVFGRLPEAERALRRALRLDPRDADAWRDLALVLSRGGRASEARVALDRSLAIDPGDAGAWLNLGNLQLRSGDAVRALTAYQSAEQHDSLLSAAYEGQLRALAALGRDSEQGAVYRRWLRRVPEAEDVRLEAVDHFTHAGRRDIAVELARDGVRHAPRSGPASLALGTALAADGQLRAALEALRHAEALGKTPEERARAGRFIALLRSGAPDSLRAEFAADSVRHAGASR